MPLSLRHFLDVKSPSKWQRTTPCCGERMKVYYGEQEVEDAISNLFFEKGKERRIIINYGGKKFDTVIIAKTLLKLGHAAKLVTKGRGILSLSLNNVTVKDLNCYVKQQT